MSRRADIRGADAPAAVEIEEEQGGGDLRFRLPVLSLSYASYHLTKLHSPKFSDIF